MRLTKSHRQLNPPKRNKSTKWMKSLRDEIRLRRVKEENRHSGFQQINCNLWVRRLLTKASLREGGGPLAVEGACGAVRQNSFYRNAFSLSRLRRQPSAQVASIACFPLWLKICHRHIFLTRRAHPEGALPRKSASLNTPTSQNLNSPPFRTRSSFIII